jgi:hypothetical protein
MSRSSQRAPRAAAQPGRRIVAALAVGSVAILGAASGGAGAGAATPATTVILGQTASTPNPSCPNLPCQAIGSVTGFQIANGQTRLPFLIPREGRITDWTLTLAQPTPKQRAFFNGFFGMPPEARLAILRRVPATSPPRYSLQSQGAVKVLSPYLGQTVKFGANLAAEKGDIVALTVPTWAPAFAQGLPASNAWRASRAAGKCTNATDVRQGEPQTRRGRRMTYGCRYTTARLLYTATLTEGR